MSPTSRTKELLKKRGWHSEVVEQTIRGRIDGRDVTFKRDYLGVVDVLAIGPKTLTGRREHIAIQCCTMTDHNRRRLKARAEPRLRLLLETGTRFLIVAWGKRGARGKPKRWTHHVEEFDLTDLDSENTTENTPARPHGRASGENNRATSHDSDPALF